MKKVLYSILFVIVVSFFQPVMAKSIQVMALNDFDTAKPPKTFEVKLMEDAEMPDLTVLKQNTILMTDVTQVINPKRLKRDAKFTLKLSYYVDETGGKHVFESKILAKYTTVIDTKDAAQKVALGVGDHFIKGLSMGVAAVKGAVKNEENNRAKSTAKAVYEASPVSYVEKGEDLVIKKDDLFLLKFELTNNEAETSLSNGKSDKK